MSLPGEIQSSIDSRPRLEPAAARPSVGQALRPQPPGSADRRRRGRVDDPKTAPYLHGVEGNPYPYPYPYPLSLIH